MRRFRKSLVARAGASSARRGAVVMAMSPLDVLTRSEHPAVRFAVLNRAAFFALEALLGDRSASDDPPRARGFRGHSRPSFTVQLLGGIDQVKLFLDLAKENGLDFDFIGPNPDGIGADFMIYGPGLSREALRVAAKPYDKVEDQEARAVYVEPSWNSSSA